MNKKLYSNGSYVVEGYKLLTVVYGKIVDTKYPSNYAVGQKVSFPAKDFPLFDSKEI